MIDKVFIIGMTGVGKSSVGKKIAMDVGFHFIDIDDYLDINSLNKYKIDKKFRQIEHDELKKWSIINKKSIISTGGGIIERLDNRNILKNFYCIHLEASITQLLSRLQSSNKFRPLIQTKPGSNINIESLKKLYNNRMKYYSEISSITINTDNINQSQTVEKIKNELIKNEFIN